MGLKTLDDETLDRKTLQDQQGRINSEVPLFDSLMDAQQPREGSASTGTSRSDDARGGAYLTTPTPKSSQGIPLPQAAPKLENSGPQLEEPREVLGRDAQGQVGVGGGEGSMCVEVAEGKKRFGWRKHSNKIRSQVVKQGVSGCSSDDPKQRKLSDTLAHARATTHTQGAVKVQVRAVSAGRSCSAAAAEIGGNGTKGVARTQSQSPSKRRVFDAASTDGTSEDAVQHVAATLRCHAPVSPSPACAKLQNIGERQGNTSEHTNSVTNGNEGGGRGGRGGARIKVTSASLSRTMAPQLLAPSATEKEVSVCVLADGLSCRPPVSFDPCLTRSGG